MCNRSQKAKPKIGVNKLKPYCLHRTAMGCKAGMYLEINRQNAHLKYIGHVTGYLSAEWIVRGWPPLGATQAK